MKKRLFTGLQSSGQLHIGNYFGALKPFLDIYKDYESFLMVADYHSLTSLKDPKLVQASIFNSVKDYIGVGVELTDAVVFKQSDVLQHTELAWVLDCQVTVPFLELGHAYKDKVAKGLEANAGLFTYPMLMAADILLYDTVIVPVGEDQRQHVEYAREAAAKFNRNYGETFIEPKEHIMQSVGTIPGTDGKKMSKSYGNTIPLFGSRDEIAKAVMSIVTDSQGERPEYVYNIHRLFKTENELAAVYETHRGKYKTLKDALVEDIDALIAPMRERRESVSDEDVKRILKEGAMKAREQAEKKMLDVRNKVGVAI